MAFGCGGAAYGWPTSMSQVFLSSKATRCSTRVTHEVPSCGAAERRTTHDPTTHGNAAAVARRTPSNNEIRMTRILLAFGWVVVALAFIGAAALLLGGRSGDAATRGIAPGLGSLFAIVGVIGAALLVWGGRGAGKPLAIALACLLALAPLVLIAVWLYSAQHGVRPEGPLRTYT